MHYIIYSDSDLSVGLFNIFFCLTLQFKFYKNQLAICFSVLVKLVDELLIQLMSHAKWKQQMSRAKGISSLLDLDPELFPIMKVIVNFLLKCFFYFVF